MKTVVLITGTVQTRKTLHEQLREYIGDLAYIKSYAVEENLSEEKIWGDVFVFSSREVREEVKLDIPEGVPVIVARRTVNYSNIDKLLLLPRGISVLYVNDIRETTYSGIDSLLGLEIDHIKYIPYYPGIDSYKKCDIAVTPGEEDKVPKEVKTVINLGPRLLEMNTLAKILYEMGVHDEVIADMSLKYIRKIIELSKKLATKTKEILEFEDHLKSELMRKRYYAKYTFEDIIGESRVITEVKNVARKLAVTDLSILIQGESGTGKELFASAIHNCSGRAKAPFIAINFSALPENLVESELFGYEGGSFTGAKREGKIGLFEQANGGTLFLDEIGEASLAVQVRLLRVLQEKEVMRVGGNRIIPLDIRIIAATNKNLMELVNTGKFREDLYYRLNMGFLRIPPLRERKQDILPIAEGFLKKRHKPLLLNEELASALVRGNWRGNVRELFNVLEYALAMCEGTELGTSHIPCEYRSLETFTEEASEVHGSNLSILQEIYLAQKAGKLVGRNMIAAALKEKGVHLSEYGLRERLKLLEKSKYIQMGKGKTGTRVTPRGAEYIQKFNG